MVGTGMIPTSSPRSIEYVSASSGTRVPFVEDEEQLDKTLVVRDLCPTNLIVVMDRTGLRDFSDPRVPSLRTFWRAATKLARSNGKTFEHGNRRGRQTDTAFLVHTSGTTGAPKGAMISNRNVMFQLELVLASPPGSRA